MLVPCPGPDATGAELDEVVAALYLEGFDPEWDVLYEPAQRVRRRLGGYEFSTQHRSWVQSTSTPHAVPPAAVGPLASGPRTARRPGRRRRCRASRRGT